MPNLTPYTLRFSGGLHVGTRGVNLEEAGVSIPSDTLFAAMLDALRRADQNMDAFATAYLKDPPFLLTSAFPYVGNLRFYPIPANVAGLFDKKINARYGKRLSHIRYMSEGLLQEAVKHGNLNDWVFPKTETEVPKKGVTLQGHALWLKVDEIKSLPEEFQRPERLRHALPRLTVWKAARVPRVTLDRITSASNIFHAGKVEFAKGCGLWFGLSWRKPDAEYDGYKFMDAVNLALQTLKDDGLGGERTTGYGAFSFQTEQAINLKDAQAGQTAYLLSRYHPRADEIDSTLRDEQAAYRLVSVAGWLRTFDGAAQRRKRVTLVEEGSLIRAGEGVMGDVVDVRPEYLDKDTKEYKPGVPHPVYRHGLALTLAWHSQGGPHA
jgi:CRISPR-associated protein Csm4